MKKSLNLVIVILIVISIGYLSLTSSPPIENNSQTFELPLVDVEVFLSVSIIGHFLVYFLLAGALLTYFHDTTRGHIEAFLIAVLFGALMEFLQLYVPNRHFDFKDILVNCIGASLVFLDHKAGFIGHIIRFEEFLIEKYLGRS